MNAAALARRRPIVVASAFVVLLTAYVTWPQSRHLATAVIAHNDPLFSMWRISWIAHALKTDPRHLFDGNIFYPTRNTLLFSDATLLEGVLATPLLWAQLPPVLVYNLLLLAGFAGSGVAMFLLARHLTGSIGPALVAAAVFVMVPYRVEHVGHLELQWAMWIPLTLLALHRTVEQHSVRAAVAAALCFWLQTLSCVYYGVFLAILLVMFVPLLVALSGPRRVQAIPALAVAALVAIALTIPYALPYVRLQQTLSRAPMEVAAYSARPINYLAATYQSWLWGWTANRWGASELRLFPGAVALALSGAGLCFRPRRWVVLYAIVAIMAVELSLGTNGTAYRWGFEHTRVLHGLRSPARFAIIAYCAVACLAAFGAEVVRAHTPVGSRWRVAAIPVLLLMAIAEYSNRPLQLTPPIDPEPAGVYQVIRNLPAGVIVELPVPRIDRLPGWDPTYAAWSTWHWRPLVNGYSGYYPADYLQTLDRMRSFPDKPSLAWLKTHQVRYVIVHRAFFEPEAYAAVLLRVIATPELKWFGTYKDPAGDADIFLLAG